MKILKIIKNILSSLLIIILLLVLAVSVYSFIQVEIQNKDYSNIFGYSIFQIETGSMSKALEIDDIIIVKIGNENLKKDDIITFKQDNNLITHRIIKIDEDVITTKGDSNSGEDESITKEDVVGKVEIIFPNIRIWKAVFTDTKVLISLGITLILFVLMVSYKEKIGEKDVR